MKAMNNGSFLPDNFRLNVSGQMDQASLVSESFDAAMESIAEAKREEYEREEQNRENIQLTAKVLDGMLATMRDEAQKAAERDREAREAATKNFWIALASMVFAALAIVAPFVIEAIKGWK